MDTATESVMMALLQRLQHDPSWHLAILMITHRSAPLAHADSVYAMKDGVLNVLATHDSRSLQHT
jgi:ABC-type transport system involved in cytochrome bd biosynthesis fused ATPase/permease subunit